MSESGRKLNNPLLSASVTGGTYEEFAQNATLFPARQIPVPVDVSNVNQSLTQLHLNTPPQSVQPQTIAFQQQGEVQQFMPVGFPNIPAVAGAINTEFQHATYPPPFTPQPPLQPSFIPQVDNSNFSSNPPISLQGSTNSYRRSGAKRPQYAQIPGLSSGSQNTPVPFANTQSISNYPTFNPAPPGNFLPGQPTASSNLVPSRIPTPKATESPVFLTPISEPQLANWTTYTPQQSSIYSSAMASVPATEIPSTSNPVMSNFQHQSLYEGTSDSVLTPGIQGPARTEPYKPVPHHWFYKQELEGRVIWHPFSKIDSRALERTFTSDDLSPEKSVPTDGGRYDVNILRRERTAVYWKSKTAEVRRCSWFYKGTADSRFTPYEENTATRLEEEFRQAFESNQWHHKVELSNGETVIFHSPDVLVLFPQSQSPDIWGNTPNQIKPRVVKRGVDEFDIEVGEPEAVDHLLFMVHGIGSVCDLKFRSVEEVVDEFRAIALQLLQSHYKSSCEKGIANRIEVLPISWHDELHSESTGIDRKLKSITLESIPRLRDFTNDTLLDILFYTSPCYCQTIISTVGNELNRVYDLFKQRNPKFKGGVSLGGHSLGSLILFDLLCHQQPEPEKEVNEAEDEDVLSPLSASKPAPLQRRMSRRISYMMGTVGTGQPQLHYPSINFQPSAFFALGSPIGMFVTVRGLDTLGEQFALPTCPAFFNIFHPYDPVAYRIESLINPQLSSLKPVLIPHHKGRKRMHLELKETVVRVGADLKQRVIESVKSTLNSFYFFTKFNQNVEPQAAIEEEVNKALEQEMAKKQETEDQEESTEQPTDLSLGTLNNGRRIDYVLQEAPFEFINEYIFALASHVCYWESEDSMLLMLKEIYGSMDITPDNQIPQQTMTIERPPSSPKSSRIMQNGAAVNQQLGIDPTMPMMASSSIGPPPTSGFVRKT